MEVVYLNHSAFVIKTKYEGNKLTKILTDPFNSEIGIKFQSTEADVVLISHFHSDHFNLAGVKGLTQEGGLDESHEALKDKPYVIKNPGQYEVKGIHIKGVKSFHDAKNGEERGLNTIYTISNEGFRICFLGDLGHKLTDSQIEEIGDVDLLLVPVGGHFTINPEIASEVISQIEPSYVIPMHYKTKNHSSDMFADVKPLDSFLEAMGAEDIKPKDSFTLSKSTEEETEVVVLKPQYE